MPYPQPKLEVGDIVDYFGHVTGVVSRLSKCDNGNGDVPIAWVLPMFCAADSWARDWRGSMREISCTPSLCTVIGHVAQELQ